MANVLPFLRTKHDPDPATPVLIDVDGDGVPDEITSPSDLAVRSDDDVALVEDQLPVVHATVTAAPGERPGELRPVVPGWQKSVGGWQAMTRWQARVQWHRLRFHGYRLPVYAYRVVRRSPRGLWRVGSFVILWTFDTRADALEQQLATGTKQDSPEFRALREDRAGRVKKRLATASGVLLALVVAVVLLRRFTDRPIQLIAAAVVLFAFARAGSDRTKPLLDVSLVRADGWRELTDAILMRGLRAAGLGGDAPKVDKNGQQTTEDTRATVHGVIARSANGSGYEVTVNLPFGKTAGNAADSVEKLASGLDVEVGQVFPEPVPGSARKVKLYIADSDPMLLPAHRSPLAQLPKVSVWDPQPVAMTPIGHVVKSTLIFCSFLLGAVPRVGKSYGARVVVTPAVLDPECDLSVFDCGGGRDWLAAENVAVDYVSGDEEEDLMRIVAMLNRVRDEARARLARFSKMSAADLPEDKLTRAMAAAGHRPHVIVVDELQNLVKSQNKEINKAAMEVLVWIAKTAPKAGYILVLITQRPAVEVVPADLRDIITIRIALKTTTASGSDAILGSYISAQGYRTDRFSLEHKGACVIKGVPTGRGGDLQYARTDLLMPADFARACAVGRQRRIEAGTLRGQAGGEEQDVVITISVLDDVHAVWPGNTPKVQARVLIGKLREVLGDRYGAMTEGDLTKALKARGVPVGQVTLRQSGPGGEGNANGYALADINRVRRAIEAGDD